MRLSVVSELEFLEIMVVDQLRVSDLLRFVITFYLLVSQRACLSMPDAFASPRLWIQYHDIIEDVLTAQPELYDDPEDPAAHQNRNLQAALSEQMEEIEHRVGTLLFMYEPVQEQTDLDSAVSDIQVRT
jgi:hypothetical protein